MRVYLDNAASTAALPEVAEAVFAAVRDLHGNPSALHALGAQSAKALARARADVAAFIHATPETLLFCGSGTEANALGLLGAARAARNKHLVTTSIEHASLYENARWLETQGWEATYIRPRRDGSVGVEEFVEGLSDHTSIVALALVNNEIGSLQPVTEISQAIRRRAPNVHIHVDAVQFVGLWPLDVRRLDADSVTISAHKLHGPKGIGALWIKPGARVHPLYAGGGQEQGLRSGTENLPACIGFAAAARALQTTHAAEIAARRDRLETHILETVIESRSTIPMGSLRAPHITSLLLPGFPAEPVLHALESRGVFASEGAACSTRKHEQSRVLKSLGIPATTGSIRFSLSRFTTDEEVDFAVKAFADSVKEIANVVKATR